MSETSKRPMIKEDNEEADYWDVLPSFQMHQSILRRKMDQVDDMSLEMPAPTYCESTVSSQEAIEEHILDATTCERSYSVGSAIDTDYGSGLCEATVIDNIDILRKIPDSRIKIDIQVTNSKPRLHVKNEPVNSLKEYMSGDLIYGYITVQNTSSKRLCFEMFTVSLEGTSIAYDKNGRPIIKKFLRMFDLSAGFHLGNISSASGLEFGTVVVDKFDDSAIGFLDSRILKPNTTYKKVFTFKAPHVLLDDTCIHDQALHSSLPPSFGTPTTFRGKEFKADIDYSVGFGMSDLKGYPVATNDGSFNSHSISYSIEARMIDKYNTKDIYNGKGGYDAFGISGEDSYSLRFIPFGFPQPNIDDKNQSAIEVENMYKEIENAIAERKASLTMNDDSDDVRITSDSAKLEQLRISESVYSDKLKEFHRPLISTTKTVFKSNKPMLSLMFNKSKFANKSSVNESIGELKVSTMRPTDGLPYISPKALQKINCTSLLSDIGLKNLNDLQNSLDSSQKADLSFLEVDLEYTLNKELPDIKHLPKVEKVSSVLWCVTFESSHPIPLLLHPDLFIEHKSNPGSFSITNIKSKLQKYLEEISSFPEETSFPKRMIDDMMSIVSLKHKLQAVPLLEVKDIQQTSWKTSRNSSSSYGKQLLLTIGMKDIIETLVPSFQSCFIGRAYTLQLTISFSGLGDDNLASLYIPLKIRNFD